uniref:Uncharacterized protein n=1 Tax=Oryza punctata TaxID=4537 RepID=A0A0E0L0L7_ORYPU
MYEGDWVPTKDAPVGPKFLNRRPEVCLGKVPVTAGGKCLITCIGDTPAPPDQVVYLLPVDGVALFPLGGNLGELTRRKGNVELQPGEIQHTLEGHIVQSLEWQQNVNA